MTTPQQMPFRLDAEQSVLGILLCEPPLLAECAGLRAIDFYHAGHQLIFASMQVLAQTGGGLFTAAAISARLAGEEMFTRLGDSYLFRMANDAPSAFMLGQFVKLVADLSARRDIVRFADHLRQQACGGEIPADQLISQAEGAMSAIAMGAGGEDMWIDGADLYGEVDGILAGNGESPFISSGLESYDRAIGGLQAARMNILAARAKMGKTAVAVWMAYRKACQGFGVGMFSLEMGRGELGMRMACAAAYEPDAPDNPEYFLAARGELSEAAREKMVLGAMKLRDLPLKIDDRAGLKPSQIVPAAKRLIRKWKKAGIRPGFIVVDHLTIVAPEYRTGNKVQEVSEISGVFRDLARDTGVTFLVLCQLSREVDKRGVANHRPQMSDIRWSGEIEQDAAQVTFLYRHERYLKKPESDNLSSPEWLEYADQKARWADRIELINEANRMGPSGTVEMGISLGCNAMWEILT